MSGVALPCASHPGLRAHTPPLIKKNFASTPRVGSKRASPPQWRWFGTRLIPGGQWLITTAPSLLIWRLARPPRGQEVGGPGPLPGCSDSPTNMWVNRRRLAPPHRKKKNPYTGRALAPREGFAVPLRVPHAGLQPGMPPPLARRRAYAQRPASGRHRTEKKKNSLHGHATRRSPQKKCL